MQFVYVLINCFDLILLCLLQPILIYRNLVFISPKIEDSLEKSKISLRVEYWAGILIIIYILQYLEFSIFSNQIFKANLRYLNNLKTMW